MITDEDIRDVRVGMSPSMDEATEVRFEDDDAVEEEEEKLLGDQSDDEKSSNKPITPWDTIDPV